MSRAGTAAERELAGRLLVGLEGPGLTGREEAWLKEWQPAGVILFSRNVTGTAQLAAFCRHIRQLLPGAEIVADHEGGPVSQLAAAVGRPPAAWALGELDDPDLTRAVHEETGRRLREVGIDRVLAPCADVLTELRNPVIGARSFGAEPGRVAVHVAAAVEGLLAAGLSVCLKHWPGHGGSRQDSHLAAATTGQDPSALPFLAGLAAGADAVMVGHLQPATDAEPATLDRDRLAIWRTQLTEAAAGPVLLLADDVTMGGLWQAMARRGFEAVDGKSTGMVDPAALTAGWLSEFVAAGADLLLVRGIPWTALPLPGTFGPFVPARVEPAVPPGGFHREEDSYREARTRLLTRERPGFPARDLTLGWLDLTRNDRWEVAGGDSAEQRLVFVAKLTAAFAGVLDLDRLEPGATGSLVRLLVTSHRPLPDSWLRAGHWSRLLAARGRCLALGHPSLKGDLEASLGSGWDVTSCYDVDWDFSNVDF